jgi:hypothetical protein
MTRRRLLLGGWLLTLGLAATIPLTAIFRGVLRLDTSALHVNGVLAHPLIAIGSDVYLPQGSRSIVIVVGGDIHIAGTASDDLVALRGRVFAQKNARLEGDVLTVVGGTYEAAGVHATGRVGGAVNNHWDGKTIPSDHNLGSILANSIRLGLAAGLALVLVGACLTIVFPWQIVLISNTLRSAPVKSVGAGVVSVLALSFLVIPLGLSLAGLPFALLLAAAAALAWLFGMTAAAVVLGRALARGPVSLLWAAAAGLLALAVAMAVPILGPLLVALVGLAGAGALAVALLTRARPLAPMP